jgi:hypothetical protein
MKLSTIITGVAITLFFIFFSCRKNKPLYDGVNCNNNCFTIVGTVIDTPSMQGIKNADVRLYFNEDQSLSIFRNTKYVGKTFTDANGKYQFRFDGTALSKSTDGYYFIKITEQAHFLDSYFNRLNNSFQLDSSHFNKTVIKDFIMFRNAKLNLRIKGAALATDHVTVSTDFGGLPAGWVLKGRRTIDTSFIIPVGGDIYTRVYLDFAKNGIGQRIIDSTKVTQQTTGQMIISF